MVVEWPLASVTVRTLPVPTSMPYIVVMPWSVSGVCSTFGWKE